MSTELTPQTLRDHAKASRSVAWEGQARMLLTWAADLIDAAISVRAEAEALRLDAERYRFMRRCDVEMYEKLHDECEDAFDAAIDAARKS